MINKENIICISTIDWDFIWQGHQEIMTRFAQSGNRVLYIDNTGVRAPALKDFSRLKKRLLNWIRGTKGFRQEKDSLYVYSPLILPFPYSKIARWINGYLLLRAIKRWIKVMRFENPIVWTFLPTAITLDIIQAVNPKLIVYYCIADFKELAGNSRKLKAAEDELIKGSDLVFVQGLDLFAKCSRINKNTHISPFGVNSKVFEDFKSRAKTIPEDILGVKKPIIGYVGGIHRHIDFGLIDFLARNNPGWSIVLIGPIQTAIESISGRKNIFLLGKKDFQELPAYIDQFDAGIIPYRLSGYTATVYPTKMNEYLAMGKAVVATNLPEVIAFNSQNGNIILIGKDHQDFENQIKKALSDNDPGGNAQRITVSQKHNWESTLQSMTGLMEGKLKDKNVTGIDWKQYLTRLYETIRLRTLKYILILLSVYFMIFYTPLMWIVAAPLKISEPAQKSDCIVVFAGGVGESGKAGQGYEERVKYAVGLFKKGYSKHLIFSSGYVYTFKEPLLMKALAVSLGVPQEAIILENRAMNTRENVINSYRILKMHNWNKILLISSPYHMKRAEMVVKKNTSGITTIYTPIPQSRFYGIGFQRPRLFQQQIGFDQIKAILHEYIAILNYVIKGWA